MTNPGKIKSEIIIPVVDICSDDEDDLIQVSDSENEDEGQRSEGEVSSDSVPTTELVELTSDESDIDILNVSADEDHEEITIIEYPDQTIKQEETSRASDAGETCREAPISDERSNFPSNSGKEHTSQEPTLQHNQVEPFGLESDAKPRCNPDKFHPDGAFANSTGSGNGIKDSENSKNEGNREIDSDDTLPIGEDETVELSSCKESDEEGLNQKISSPVRKKKKISRQIGPDFSDTDFPNRISPEPVDAISQNLGLAPNGDGANILNTLEQQRPIKSQSQKKIAEKNIIGNGDIRISTISQNPGNSQFIRNLVSVLKPSQQLTINCYLCPMVFNNFSSCKSHLVEYHNITQGCCYDGELGGLKDSGDRRGDVRVEDEATGKDSPISVEQEVYVNSKSTATEITGERLSRSPTKSVLKMFCKYCNKEALTSHIYFCRKRNEKIQERRLETKEEIEQSSSSSKISDTRGGSSRNDEEFPTSADKEVSKDSTTFQEASENGERQSTPPPKKRRSVKQFCIYCNKKARLGSHIFFCRKKHESLETRSQTDEGTRSPSTKGDHNSMKDGRRLKRKKLRKNTIPYKSINEDGKKRRNIEVQSSDLMKASLQVNGSQTDEGTKSLRSSKGCHSSMEDGRRLKRKKLRKNTIPDKSNNKDGKKKRNETVQNSDFMKTSLQVDDRVKRSSTLQYYDKIKKTKVCPKCKKRFASVQRLKIHQRLHNGRRYCCFYCNRPFTDSYSLTKHAHLIHGDIRPWKCGKCAAAFENEKDLKNHAWEHHQGYDPIDIFMFNKRLEHATKYNSSDDEELLPETSPNSDLKEEVALANRVRCSRIECSNNWFDSVSELREHVRSNHRIIKAGNKKCSICNQTFNTISRLALHRYINHLDIKSFQCPHCSLKLGRAYHLKRHCQDIHDDPIPWKCKMDSGNCNQAFPTFRQYKKHATNEHSAEEFKTNPEFAYLLPSETLPASSSSDVAVKETSITCWREECSNVSFDSMAELVEHTNSSHRTLSAEKSKLNCKNCLMQFTDISSFVVHRYMHLGIKMFQCPRCSLKCSRPDTMKVHCKRWHNDKLPFKCKMGSCTQQEFSSISELKQHALLKHSTKEIYAAPELAHLLCIK